MFDSLITAVKAAHPSARSILMVIAVALVVVAALVSYDLKLKEARLNTIDRSMSLLRESQVMLQSSDPELQEAASLVKRQALDLLDRAEMPEPLSPYLKFGVAVAPWALICLLTLVFGRTDNYATWFFKSLPIILLGMPFGLIGAFLPDAQLPWFNLVIYPAGHFILFIAIGLIYMLDKGIKDSCGQMLDESDQD